MSFTRGFLDKQASKARYKAILRVSLGSNRQRTWNVHSADQAPRGSQSDEKLVKTEVKTTPCATPSVVEFALGEECEQLISDDGFMMEVVRDSGGHLLGTCADRNATRQGGCSEGGS